MVELLHSPRHIPRFGNASGARIHNINKLISHLHWTLKGSRRRKILQLNPSSTAKRFRKHCSSNQQRNRHFVLIQSEGEAHNAETEKLAEETKKAKRGKIEKPAVAVKSPVESRINSYGFISMRKQWLADLGWAKGTALAIEKNAEGGITVRKA